MRKRRRKKQHQLGDGKFDTAALLWIIGLIGVPVLGVIWLQHAAMK